MRDTKIIELRPVLKLSTTHSNSTETFQNNTLRPILKLQHPISLNLLYHSKHYGDNIKNVDLKNVSLLNEFIKNHISKNKDLRHKILGIMIGMMTEIEYSFYLDNESELNKRIISMQIKRYVDTISKRW